jgi:isoleucyl-tRNA synthetase
MDYSDSLNLPNTKFSMKANLSLREPEFLKEWEEKNIYKKIIEKNLNKEPFILHDGPPYANGHIHLGHSLNKILKDIIVKSKNMSGYFAPYVPGWDCHGLPIELQVVKELKGENISKYELRKRCRNYAEKFIKIQKEEFKRLGVLGDWDNYYYTMSNLYEYFIVKSFGEFVEKGFIYRALKPVFWCPHCKTALAEAEVEYKEDTSDSITVKFPLKNKPSFLEDFNGYWLIWTTTPWTLPANVAVCIHPENDYVAVLVEYNNKKEWWLLADALLNSILDKTKAKVIKKLILDKKEVLNYTALHLFISGRESKVVFDKFVTMDTGTGVVHIAPGHGEEDYLVGKNFNLPVLSPVDEAGNFTNEVQVESLIGKNVFKANKDIIKILKNLDLLLMEEKISHSYPHCWRCKNPIIFRATNQWFLSIDHRNLREECIKAIKNVKWIPEWGEERLENMLKIRPDWCLSRQRSWGVPIPAFYCQNCGNLILEKSIIDNFAEIVKENSTDIWFEKSEKELLPENYKCPKCGGTSFKKEEDIIDVWFDSGVSHIAVLENTKGHSSPADMYLEGSDQYRGWFQSSLIPAVALRNKAPYKIVLTHGFILDADGKAMHKSAGNVIAPKEVINKYGADILRLWVCSLDYRDDARIGDEILKRIVESYRKIRNTLRFMLGNLANFNFNDKFNYNDLSNFDDFDLWAYAKLIRFNETILKAYQNYQFHLIYHNLINFCATTLSSLYFDVLKDRLYVEPKDSFKAISSRYMLLKIFKVLTKLIAPVLSFTAEDAWKTFCEEHNLNYDSIHLQEFEKIEIELENLKEYEEKWDKLFEIKEAVNKANEKAKSENKIGHTLEAKIIIVPLNEKIKNFLKENLKILTFAFIVSQVELSDDKFNSYYYEDNNLKIFVDKAEGKKCSRCWNWSNYVGTDNEYPELCERCANILRSKR